MSFFCSSSTPTPSPATAALGAPATPAMLAALSALPSSMLSKPSRSRKSRGRKLTRDGRIVSKFYLSAGVRPYPSNGISLEQEITVELTNVVQTWLTSSAVSGTNTYAAQNFTLSLFNAATSMAAVFDQYRIDQIECWVDPVGIASTSYPFLSTAVDIDDSNTPASAGQVLDKQGAVSGTGQAGHYHRWLPHMAIAAYSGAFTSYTNEPAQWIDCASPAVQHYGLKALSVSNGTTPVVYTLSYRAVISFRSPVIN